TAVIFVHAANSNRLGPHRMFVELAQRLSRNSIASMRFDMRGCGDSTGQPAKQIQNDIEDLLCSINFFNLHYKPEKILLFGISRGAKVIFETLAKHNVPADGCILLSIPHSSGKTALKSFTARLKEYLYKFKNPQSLKKILTGKANIMQIFRTLAFALNIRSRYQDNSDQNFTTTCPLFFIYAAKDPIAAASRHHYTRICKKFAIPNKINVIKNANHSFFHYKWKEQIFDETEKWIMEN
ncbi:MAG: alpha/beta fold hydrolase, partial [Phycisphaerae bacterium]|nr:alpha/beta fold hydrolase [Phycisphaerae bacterium]